MRSTSLRADHAGAVAFMVSRPRHVITCLALKVQRPAGRAQKVGISYYLNSDDMGVVATTSLLDLRLGS